MKQLTPKELTPTQSIKAVKDLIRSDKVKTKTVLVPGNLLMYHYNAKDKEQTYDKTPLVLILRTGTIHTMGLNFHWLPMPMRVMLIKHIIKINKKNIKENKLLDFDYVSLKPMLKKLGYAPCVRLYLNNRISSSAVKIPSDKLLEAARLKTETFTNGRYSAEQLYKKAVQRVKKYKQTRKRRE